MFELDSPQQLEALLTQLQWLDGGEAIYHEGRLVAHICITDIRLDEIGIRAEARLLRSLAAGGSREEDLVKRLRRWSFGAAWCSLTIEPWRWLCAYPGWSLRFHPGDVAALHSHRERPHAETMSAARRV